MGRPSPQAAAFRFFRLMAATGLVIADSSIWIDHINQGDPELVDLMKQRRVRLHPMIIAEIALGSIKQRATMLEELNAFPQIDSSSHSEVMAMIEWVKLFGTGVGYVDAHLLAATRQLRSGLLWTRDKCLKEQAKRLGVAYQP
jgi:predicted nucleic acid-binding protein